MRSSTAIARKPASFEILDPFPPALSMRLGYYQSIRTVEVKISEEHKPLEYCIVAVCIRQALLL